MIGTFVLSGCFRLDCYLLSSQLYLFLSSRILLLPFRLPNLPPFHALLSSHFGPLLSSHLHPLLSSYHPHHHLIPAHLHFLSIITNASSQTHLDESSTRRSSIIQHTNPRKQPKAQAHLCRGANSSSRNARAARAFICLFASRAGSAVRAVRTQPLDTCNASRSSTHTCRVDGGVEYVALRLERAPVVPRPPACPASRGRTFVLASPPALRAESRSEPSVTAGTELIGRGLTSFFFPGKREGDKHSKDQYSPSLDGWLDGRRIIRRFLS